jgi:hypothetical protein
MKKELEEVEAQPEFEVDKIVGKRLRKGEL